MSKLSAREVDSPRAKYLKEEVLRRQKQREVMDDLVKQNQERLRLANEAAREDMLNRIHDNKERADSLAEERAQAQLQRTLLLKEALVERDCLQDTLRSQKTSPRSASPESPEAKEAK